MSRLASHLSPIQSADQILVLDHGRVVEMGKHTELLANRGLDARLYAMNFQDEDVAASAPAARDGG